MIIAATDGSSLGNPGAGGWCWYLSPECWRAGGFTLGTNNQAELMAVADLLTETATVADDLLIQADSQYVINILTKWRFGWKKKGWKTGGGKPVANLELVKRLDQLLSDPARKGKVSFEWVKGHAGHPLNEQADSHAQAIARAYQSGSPREADFGPGWKSGKESTSERTSDIPAEDAAKTAKYRYPEDPRETRSQQNPVAPAAAPARPLYPQLEQNPSPKEYRQGRYLIREHVLTVPLYHSEVALKLFPDSAKNPVVNLARGTDIQESGVQSELFAVTSSSAETSVKSPGKPKSSESNNQFLPPWVDAEIRKTNIQIYAREIAFDDDENRPYLIFFQGGPGCKGSRPADWSSPWFGAALEKYRIIMLDQRGTGRSTPLDNVTIPALGSRAGAWLRLMRADQIVGDAEALRRALGIKKWTVMGQSFGGFIITAYLSRFPEAIEKAYITGGLPGLTKVNRIYEQTFAATARRCREFYALPGMEEAVSDALRKKLILWNIKSTTKAQEGLYVYDVVQRLYDSQFGSEGVDNIEKYVKLGKLGEAFTAKRQVVLLIDEIDKADLEFPNDLLWELDRMEFHIPETGRTVTAKHRPVVIITSNAEKELPDAFLRRCVFHYIEFPDKELLAEIIRVHFPDLNDKLLSQVLEAFYRIRSLPQIKKKPSTSEAIDWIQALIHGGVNPERIVKEVPYLGVLLKKNEDIDALRLNWR